MKLGQFVIAKIDDKECTLTNQLYQSWKSNPRSFVIDDQTYNKIVKHSTTLITKAKKARWFTFVDGAMMEVLDDEDYKPRKEIEAVAYRSVKTWFEITNEEN